ncbi:DNA mismatch repair protein MutS [Maribacter sp. BPC-D8]|uniref:MutS-related protein n=1 Tax=Maribacter sp. BPC-D8 TaxID=3053613 RepID=UPI002B472A11|nr:DNA mismatch repair protein MutS [Maribacter sp. BPC-D8]WRI30224.1 DNA mismatch repair protein MutS [Maribacter sp. BPC-D8]
MFRKKRKQTKRLTESFGKLKNESFDFQSIRKYFENKDNSKAFQVLSDKTCLDLDFEELFMFLDRTTSKIGQQYLYNNLRTIEIDPQKTSVNEEIIQLLSEDAAFRIKIQSQLERLSKYDVYRISELFQKEHPQPPKWFFVVKLLSFTSLLSFILMFFSPNFLFLFLGVFATNFIIHIWNKKNLLSIIDAIPQLLRLNNFANYFNSIKELKKLNPNLAGFIKTINRVKYRMSFLKLETKLQGEFESIAWIFLELVKIIFLLEPLLLFGVLNRLNTKREEIANVFEFVGRIDMLISIASLRKGLDNFCIPEINNTDKKIKAIDIYHPLIINCTTNTLEVSDKSILLTGSNMAGKTSFIRTIGLNLITGLTINTCFAKSLIFPVTRIFSAIRISDDLLNDKSYYFEEVLTIKEMITESENENINLFLLDEIYKGTNTIERISAGKAVLSTLAKNGNIVFVSTHDIELTEMLSEEYELFHFSEIVNEKTVDFDYKLKKGKLKNRNAIKILQINGYPEEVVKEAIVISKELDKISKTQKEKH